MKRLAQGLTTVLLAMLLCGTALAADKQFSPSSTDSTVKIQQTAKDGNVTFSITKESGAETGKFYLLLIQSGTSTGGKPANPTKENVTYLNWQQADKASFTFEAYPDPAKLSGGNYTVYLSDYSGGNNGDLKNVGTISANLSNENEYKMGDVNHSGGEPDNRDVRDLFRYVSQWPEYQSGGKNAIDLSLSDVNDSGGNPDNRDVRDLFRYVSQWPEYTSLPYKK